MVYSSPVSAPVTNSSSQEETQQAMATVAAGSISSDVVTVEVGSASSNTLVFVIPAEHADKSTSLVDQGQPVGGSSIDLLLAVVLDELGSRTAIGQDVDVYGDTDPEDDEALAVAFDEEIDWRLL